MTSPTCPRCGQPLRWFPEMYAWGCDTCRQMMPAQQPAAAAAPLPAMQHAAVRRSRMGLWVGLAAVVVVGGGVAAVLVAGGKDEAVAAAGGGSGTGTGTGTGTGMGTGSASAVEPSIPSTGIAECDKVAALRVKIEACAAIPAGTRTTALQMADNNLSGAQGATGEYAEYVRPRCAGTAAFLGDTLAEAGCAPRARAQATGFSVPIASGWQVIRENGQRPNELILEQLLPDIGATTRAGIYLELVPFSDKANATGTAENCTSFASYVARTDGATLDEHGLVTTRVGPACLNRVNDGRERRLGMQVNLQGKHILGVTCTYDHAAITPPVGCVEIVDGLTLD